MISEPNIDKSNLIELLEDNFNFKVGNITFNPKGEASWSYFVDIGDEKYFLKLFKIQDFNLAPFEFTARLFSECEIKNIIHPIKTTSDKIFVSFEDFKLVLFGFIDGKTIREQPLNESQLEELGELLVKVHNSKDIIGAYPQKEEFDNPHKNDINKIYESLEKLDDLNEIKEKTKQLYLDYKDKFLDEQNKLEELINKLKDQNIEFVNCHGEPSPGNVMVSNDGQIFLIDWDFPLFAPKEKDLLFFDKSFDQVLAGYRKVVPDVEINEDVKRYYSLLWNVQEIADWGIRILFGDASLEEHNHSYEELTNFLNYSGLK
jgi:spectinomycin phosphotransferase